MWHIAHASRETWWQLPFCAESSLNASFRTLARFPVAISCCCYCDDGGGRGGSGLLVSGAARVRRTLSNLQSAQDPLVRALPAGSLPVQASAESRGPDAPAAGLGAVPPHEEQRTGPHAPRESGERLQESPRLQRAHRPQTGPRIKRVIFLRQVFNNTLSSGGHFKGITEF